MELRHLRYFIAVAEEGSLTVAAERRLHTASTLTESADPRSRTRGRRRSPDAQRARHRAHRGRRVFLDHARLSLAQAEAAIEAARRAARPPAKPSFALGFLTGQEMDWLPAAMDVLRHELPNIDVTVSSDTSPRLADALVRGKIDLAFLRPEPQMPSLAYRTVLTEPLVVMMPSDHRLARHKAVAIEDLATEPFIGMSGTAPVLQSVDRRLPRAGRRHVAHRA